MSYHFFINKLLILVPEELGESIVEGLKKIKAGEDPEDGKVHLEGLFLDSELNEERNKRFIGLLEFLAPLYTFTPKAWVYKYADSADTWGCPDTPCDSFGVTKFYNMHTGDPIKTIYISFETAGAPPIGAIQKFMSLVPEADISLYYSSPSQDLCGEMVKMTPGVSSVLEPFYTFVGSATLSNILENAAEVIFDPQSPNQFEIDELTENFNITEDFAFYLVEQFADAISNIKNNNRLAEDED